MYAEIVILAVLQTGPQHGYEIKKNVERILGGSIAMNNKVLYPALKRFEEMGALQRTVERQEGKPDRHIYRLTERGMEVLHGLLREFSPELANHDAEFFTRLAFAHLLEPARRLEILTTRANVIAGRLTHLQEMKIQVDEGEPMPFAQQVLRFHLQKARLENDWLRELIEETRALVERSNT